MHSEQKPIKISGKVAVGVVRDSRKFSGHPYIGRIARSSCDSSAFFFSIILFDRLMSTSYVWSGEGTEMFSADDCRDFNALKIYPCVLVAVNSFHRVISHSSSKIWPVQKHMIVPTHRGYFRMKLHCQGQPYDAFSQLLAPMTHPRQRPDTALTLT